jgi:hypothetical protein
MMKYNNIITCFLNSNKYSLATCRLQQGATHRQTDKHTKHILHDKITRYGKPEPAADVNHRSPPH